jgi:multidrug resistance protein MdtO
MGTGKAKDAPDPALIRLAVEGIVEPLHLLALAGKIEPWLKQHQAELRAKFVLADRLVESAALLEQHKSIRFDESIEQRLLNVADACRAWQVAIKQGKKMEIPVAQAQRPPSKNSTLNPVTLLEMERVAALMPSTFRNDDLPDELKPPPEKKKGSLLVPDAFTNPEYIYFGVKGGVAALICYLIFTSVKYEGIDTAITTCVVCSLATVGASVQKGILRIAGAAVGGLLGFLTLAYVFPNLDSLGGFWFPVAAVTGLAAWVNFGSARIAYCGFQINYAFFNCVLQSYGPYTELRVVRDRLIGILLGLLVYGFINARLWPVSAVQKTEEKIADTLRLLAKMILLNDDGLDPKPQLAEAYSIRLQLYQHLTGVRQLLESSKFEGNKSRREYLEKVRDDVELIFLRILAIIQHRADLRPQMAPELVRATALRLKALASETLLKFANRIEGKTAAPLPDLQGAMDGLARAVSAEIGTVTDADNASKILARVALYSETILITQNMTR